MKTLYIVRHAKSSWSDVDLADIDRPLKERGVNDAIKIGERLRERNINPDIIICSGWMDKDYLKITKLYFKKILMLKTLLKT